MLQMSTISAEPRVDTRVPFCRPASVDDGIAAVAEAVASGAIKAGGAFTKQCEQALERATGATKVLMVGSCTAALELSAILLGIEPGEEIIMPSFGFASAANAFVLRGATPVFVDIAPDTLNLDVAAVADAITDRTRAIVPVHYAGVGADMDALVALAAEHDLTIIEDAAQGIGARYRTRPLGTFGALGAISFDATKNISCGAGGALLVNDPQLVERAEWIRDCGTDRAGFDRGLSRRYQWVDTGSNYALNELAAAYLSPQLAANRIAGVTAARMELWQRYHAALAPAEAAGLLRRPTIPAGREHNAHTYGIIVPSADARTALLRDLDADGISATFHFVPLHSAPAGRRHGRVHGSMANTDAMASRLVRLPLWEGLGGAAASRVAASVVHHLRASAASGSPA